MFVPNYKDTESVLALMIFDLARGEEVIRERLIKVFTERAALEVDDFPEQLQKDWTYIVQFITSKSQASYASAYRNSLRSKWNKTCSVVVGKIVDLYCTLKIYNN